MSRKQIQDIAVDEGDDVRIHIDRMASPVKATVPSELLMSRNWCIFKIPVTHMRHNQNAFIPNAFSIGPIHHGKQNLKATEKIKVKYSQDLISRSPSPETMRSIMVSSIMEVEKKARECYADAIHYNPDELVNILVTDGCFIIEFFYKNYNILVTDAAYSTLRKEDPIFSRSCMLSFLSHDLILLENQVPWMILELLFKLTVTQCPSLRQKPEPLVTLARTYVKHNFPSYSRTKDIPQSDSRIKIEDIKHFLGLLREFSISPSTNPPPDQSNYIGEGTNHCVQLFRKLLNLPRTERKMVSRSTGRTERKFPGIERNMPQDQRINSEGTNNFVQLFRKLLTLPSTLFGKLLSPFSPRTEKKSTEEHKGGWKVPSARWRGEQVSSATSLVEAGIKFKRHESSQSILDIKFEDGGVLNIPPLEIDDSTETLFRNLISYEQCLPGCEDRFTSYAMFLDNLIITTKDMNILCENQIIDNWLNPEDATQLFNKLYYDTCVVNQCKNICGDVNRFCERRWPRWRATLVRNYFNTPWAGLSTSAAVILLILTLLQTIYGIKK